MATPNWIAVFKAEYYTTTAKFRRVRSWIPLFFIAGVVFFSYYIKGIIDLIAPDGLGTPPLIQFFAIISVFTFFTMFSPIISPLGRSVFDGSMYSRKEIALSTPVRPHELLYGNLLSNIVFFLPFYVFVGTIALSVFVGNGSIPPLVSASILILALVLIVLLGLFLGTIVTPLVFNFIANQRSDKSKAIVMVFVSTMLLTALPLLKYIIDLMESPEGLGWILYLPFTLAASAIIFALYGEVVGVDLGHALFMLTAYNIVVIIIGYLLAARLFEGKESVHSTVEKTSTSSRVVETIAKVVPNQNLRKVYVLMTKAALRDIEQISRLTIGISATVFFLFALSPRGLFEGTPELPEEFEVGLILYSLIIAASTTIYIEASAFLIQHRSMLALIKSSPNGAKTFIQAKILQILTTQIPVYILLMGIVPLFGFSTSINFIWVAGQLILVIFVMAEVVIALYMVYPADNEEDISNFIILLVFYVFSFTIAVIPIFQAIAGIKLQLLLVFVGTMVMLGIGSQHVAITALEQMDVETLSSKFSQNIIRAFLSLVITITAWNIIPLFGLLLVTIISSATIIILVSATSPAIIPTIEIMRNRIGYNVQFTPNMLKEVIRGLLILTPIALVISAAASLLGANTVDIISALSQTGFSVVIVVTYVVIAVVVEELYFRGFLIDYLNNSELSENIVVLLSSLLFALFHILSIFSFLNALFAGIVFAKLRNKHNNLAVPMLVHLIYNMSLLALLFVTK